jgi:hypothetical protein
MIEHPSKWTDEDRRKVLRAIAEHRLNRVDLYVWREMDVEGRSVHDMAVEFFATHAEIERRVEAARQRLQATLERPSQEAYLGRWVTT